MGFQSFDIVLDPEQPVYIAGQVVKGYISIAAPNTVDCRSIKVWVKGKAKVRWSKGSGKNRRTYKAEEKYFRYEMVVWKGTDTGNRFQAGSFRFPFSFTLPRNIPSSFTSPSGNVIYKVEAQADIPFQFDQHRQKLFSVNYLYDLNQDLHAMQPMNLQKEKTVCCLCCAQGPIRLNMWALRSGYVPGESVVVNGEVGNHSSSTIQYTEIKLQQLITYIARSHTKKVQRTVQRVYHPQLEGGGTDVWSAVPLPIPAVPASHLLHCNLITIDYAFVLVAKLGTCRNAKVMAPVVIGTLPLRGTYSTFNPANLARDGGTSVTTSLNRSGRSSPAPFDPSSPLPSAPPPHSPSAPSVPSLHAPPSAPPVPPHRPYFDPPPPYTASLLPDEYGEVPPPSYAACVFGLVGTGNHNSGGGGGGGGGSDDSDEEGGFTPHYLTYRTNT